MTTGRKDEKTAVMKQPKRGQKGSKVPVANLEKQRTVAGRNNVGQGRC